MLVFSRTVGQSFAIDESTVFRLVAVGREGATLLRTDGGGLHADEVTIQTRSLQEIAPGVRAILILDQPEVPRIGFEAAPAVRIRRIDEGSLKVTRTINRENRI